MNAKAGNLLQQSGYERFLFFFFQPPFLSLTLHFFSSDSFKCYVQLRTEHELSFFNQFTLIGADAE